MRKKYVYLLLIAVFIVLVVAIIIRYNENENKLYGIIERKGQAAQSKEWKEVQQRAKALIAAIKADPEDTKSALKLTALFIEEARVTGNYMYYDKAALRYMNNILKAEPQNFYALVFKSLIYLSQHHFAEGLATAGQARQINPSNAYVYGLLVDGNVEMGYYDSAVVNADKMNSIRPDLTSYSRVSYLREIYGDYQGAIQAMKMAVETGGAGDEHTEWTRTQLGNLYEKTGDFKAADSLYEFALSLRPNYPYALAGLARIALVANDYNKAIAYYQKADSMVNDNSLKEELADAYRMAGQNKKADEMTNKTIEELTKDSQTGDKDASIGHYADRELAYAYLKVNNVDKALEHAILEFNRRPENIDVNETVAWVYYNKGECAKALPYIKTALKTHSKNPVLLTRASLIFYKTGDKQLAKSMLQEASSTNAYIGNSLKQETLDVMQNL
ncbi:MAG: tetratricopeptide repeat protein [Ginsengibacter sp.]